MILPPSLGGGVHHSVRAVNARNQSNWGAFHKLGGAHGVTRPTMSLGAITFLTCRPCLLGTMLTACSGSWQAIPRFCANTHIGRKLSV